MRCLYSPVKDRRLASATTSGFGRGGLGGWGATVLPAAVLRSFSLRSFSLRSAAGKTVGEVEDIPLFFTLIPVLALLSNYDRENCLINVGTEGGAERILVLGALYQINPATGHTTFVCPTDTNLTTIVNVNDTIYSFDAAAGQVVTLDLASGQTTQISPLDPAASIIAGATPARPSPAADH